jgi:hypothetical protein
MLTAEWYSFAYTAIHSSLRSPVPGHVGCFQFFTGVNSAALNVPVSWHMHRHASLGYVSAIPRLENRCLFIFVWWCSKVSIQISTPTCSHGSVISYPHSHLHQSIYFCYQSLYSTLWCTTLAPVWGPFLQAAQSLCPPWVQQRWLGWDLRSITGRCLEGSRAWSQEMGGIARGLETPRTADQVLSSMKSGYQSLWAPSTLPAPRWVRGAFYLCCKVFPMEPQAGMLERREAQTLICVPPLLPQVHYPFRPHLKFLFSSSAS